MDPNKYMDSSKAFSHDLTKHIRPCGRCGQDMAWKGEVLLCPGCGLAVMTNQAAVLFGHIREGVKFVLPPTPDIIWEKTNYNHGPEPNAVQINDVKEAAVFSDNDIIIMAVHRLIGGFFSYN